MLGKWLLLAVRRIDHWLWEHSRGYRAAVLEAVKNG